MDQSSSAVFVEKDIETSASASASAGAGAGAGVTRRRDIALNFKKIVKPNNAKIRIRDRVHVLLGDIKNYTKTDGTAVTEEEKAKLVENNVNRLNHLVHDICDKMKEELDIANNDNPVVWSDVPVWMIDKYANKIEKAAADLRLYIDRCENKWAASGMLAEHYQNNFNPSVMVC